MDPNLKKFSDAVIAGATQGGPVSSIPELSAYFKAPQAANLTGAATGAANTDIGQIASDQAVAASNANKLKIQQLQDQLDPSKYYKTAKADGGFDFYDPTGKKIDVNTYAQRTGQNQAQVLKDSNNPIDREFVNDYSNMQNLVDASNNRDKQTVQAYVDQNPDLKNHISYDQNTGQITDAGDLLKLLVQKYPHVFGAGSYQQTYDNRNQRLYNNNGLGSAGGTLASLGQ